MGRTSATKQIATLFAALVFALGFMPALAFGDVFIDDGSGHEGGTLEDAVLWSFDSYYSDGICGSQVTRASSAAQGDTPTALISTREGSHGYLITPIWAGSAEGDDTYIAEFFDWSVEGSSIEITDETDGAVYVRGVAAGSSILRGTLKDGYEDLVAPSFSEEHPGERFEVALPLDVYAPTATGLRVYGAEGNELEADATLELTEEQRESYRFGAVVVLTDGVTVEPFECSEDLPEATAGAVADPVWSLDGGTAEASIDADGTLHMASEGTVTVVCSVESSGCVVSFEFAVTSGNPGSSGESDDPGPGDSTDNPVSSIELEVSVDYTPVPKGMTAVLSGRPRWEAGISAFELYWQYRAPESGMWIDVLDLGGERLMSQTLRVPTNDETIGRQYRACLVVNDPDTGERVEVCSNPVTITESQGFFTVQIEYDPPQAGCVAIFQAYVSGVEEPQQLEFYWQISTDNGATNVDITGPNNNAEEHKSRLYIPTAKPNSNSGDSSADSLIPTQTLIRVIARAPDGREAISEWVMLTMQSDEGITYPSGASSSISLAAQTKTYNAKAQAYTGKVTKFGSTGEVTYAYYSDPKCTKKAAPKAVGTYYVKATLAADDYYESATSAAAKFTIEKAKNPVVFKAQTKTIKYAKLKKAKQVVAITKASKAQGEVTYKKVKVNKKAGNFAVNKTTGKITVKKGTPKGAYKVTVQAYAKGNPNYYSAKVKRVITVKVK